jgi:hypothetical protein
MSSNQPAWRSWAQTLHRWGIAEEIAAFLEAVGPLTLIAAQFFYISQPFFRSLLFDINLEEIGLFLEDRQGKDEFVALLRGDFPA